MDPVQQLNDLLARFNRLPGSEELDELDRFFCISYRCRLCRFPIRLGGPVVADVGDCELSSIFNFSHEAHFESNLLLRGCHLTCSHKEEKELPAYHVECLRFSPPLSRDGLRATKYTYEPTTSEDPRRALRTRDVAARRLQMEYPFLPAEVCLPITEELVRECAATAMHELLKGRSAHALDYDVLLLGAEKTSAPELLYALEDHLGIRQVVFASYEYAIKLPALLCKPKTDAWWRTIPITGKKLIVKSDGVKLRSIASKSTRNSPDSTTVAWPTPMAPFQEPMFTIRARILINKPIVAAMATEQLWQNRPHDLEDADIHNRIEMNVRARYIYINGVRYVESLISLPYAEGEVVLEPATASNIDVIHVLKDHIGVRRVLFSSTEHSQKLEALLSTPVKDAWALNCEPSKLTAVVRAPSHQPEESTSEDVEWPRPMYPANELVLQYSNLNTWEIEEERRNERWPSWTSFTRYRFPTISFDCNHPAVTGYSVCFKAGLRGIYAHRGDDLEMYNDVDMCTRPGIWIHMPVDPHERISAIWIRSQDMISSSGLILQTDKGRQVMFGWRADGQNRLDKARLWTRLPGVSESPFRVYCKLSYRGVDQIAVQPQETLAEEPPRQMKPWPALPSPTPRRQHFSAVSLDDVAEMIPCGREISFEDGDYWVITGIMVHYVDGHRACAGEFRADCAGESMRVDNTSLLLLGFYVEENENHRRRLAAIESEPPDDDGFLAWKSLRCVGKLQWWFDEQGRCQIFHRNGEGQLSRV
ncbi:hypothetical protein LCI18_013334 [Fusarium solani-melongenae]|uniref:Uncharacterized protein n=1 Tax=Fusarium solani subsp. cucurbitae TaxID=2747967 RepID=A0ACD3ZM21_FUSSC|nr:hypothetical protein LCI18_013334 [Fusarium solani-melongenae]